LAWYRRLVARKFDGSPARRAPGRPRIDRAVEQLIVRMAEENRSWSYDRIVGALANLGHEVSDQTVSNVLRRHGIPVVPPKKLAGTERAGIATARAIPGQAHRSPRSPRTDLRLVHRRLRRAGPLRRRGAARRSGVTHQRRPSLSRYNCTVGSLGDDHRGPGPSRSPRDWSQSPADWPPGDTSEVRRTQSALYRVDLGIGHAKPPGSLGSFRLILIESMRPVRFQPAKTL
jgi:hypothetical protein